MEPNWPKAVYLYVICGIAVLVMAAGAVTAALGLVHTIAPGFDQKSTVERLGIGVSKIADGVMTAIEDQEKDQNESFCKNVSDTDSEFDACMDDESSGSGDSFDLVRDGIAEVQDEFDRQTRNSGLNGILRGLALLAAGFFVHRFHWRRSELGAPRATKTGTSDVAPPTVSTAATDPSPSFGAPPTS